MGMSVEGSLGERKESQGREERGREGQRGVVKQHQRTLNKKEEEGNEMRKKMEKNIKKRGKNDGKRERAVRGA